MKLFLICSASNFDEDEITLGMLKKIRIFFWPAYKSNCQKVAKFCSKFLDLYASIYGLFICNTRLKILHNLKLEMYFNIFKRFSQFLNLAIICCEGRLKGNTDNDINQLMASNLSKFTSHKLFVLQLA